VIERKGVGGGIDGDDPPLDGETAFAGGRLMRLAARGAKDDAQQQTGSKKNPCAQGAPPHLV
jgi:hypothetical protein